MPVTTAPPVPRPGSSLQLALMAAGPHRQALTAWVRWWHEVSDIPYSVSDPSVADRKLIWWGQAVADAFQSPPQHPLLRAMTKPGMPLTEPPLALWLEQIEGLRTLTQQTRWLDDAPLERHAWATTGAAAEGLVWLMGAREPQVLSLARRLGVGLRRAHILARLGQDAQQGWLHIPIDTLQAHNVKAHELLKPTPGPAKAEIRQLLTFWHRRCAQDVQRALSEAKALPAEQRHALKPLVVLGRLNLALMNDLNKADYAVLRQRIMLGPWRKLWLGWRAQWF